MSEKQLQKMIIEFLNYNDCNVWMINSGMIKTENRMFKAAPKGHSDIQGIHKPTGKFIAIEVKLPERRKNVTEFQQMFLDEIKMCGGISGVATSPEEALDIIRQQA